MNFYLDKLILMIEEDFGKGIRKFLLALVVVTISLFLITASVFMIKSMVEIVASKELYFISLAVLVNLIIFISFAYLITLVFRWINKRDVDRFIERVDRRAEEVRTVQEEAIALFKNMNQNDKF